MATPGVADRPGAIDAEPVQHGDRIGDMALDDVWLPDRCRVKPALLIADGVKTRGQLRRQALGVIREARTAVHQQGRLSGPLSPGRDVACRGLDQLQAFNYRITSCSSGFLAGSGTS